MKTKKRYFTEQEFKQVKLLQEAGLTSGQICKVLKRSFTPITTSMEAKNFDEYKIATAKRYPKPQAQQPKEPESLPGNKAPLVTPNNSDLMDVLKSIDDSLKFLVDHLPVPEKRRLFR